MEEEGDDDIPYNPKNLPLGWDGKFDPINHIESILSSLKYLIQAPQVVGHNHDIYAQFPQANLYHIGCTSCMVSTSPTIVRFVETSPTKDPRLSRDILQVDSFLNLV